MRSPSTPRLRASAALSLFILMALLWSGPGQTAEPRQYRLGPDLEYGLYLDESGTLGVAEIAALKAESFTPQHGVPALGYTRTAAWLRFEPPPLAPGQDRWWLEVAPSYLDQVDLYQNDGAGWSLQRAGDRRPFAERPIAHRHFLFPLDSNTQGPLLVRLQSTSSLLGLIRLWEPGAFLTFDTQRSLAWGLHLGANAVLVASMAILALMFSNRELAIIATAGLLNWLATAVLKGFQAEWFWPSQPLAASHAVGWIVNWTLASALWMMRELLTRGTRHRWLDRWLNLCIWLFLLAPLSLAVDRYGEIMGPIYLLHTLAAASAAWLALKAARERPGAYEWAIFAAFLLYVSTTVPLLLVLLGLLDRASPMMSVWIVAIPLFLAIAGTAQALRIRQQYRSMGEARNRALELAQTTERHLEHEVRQRTSELVYAQKQLHESLEFERRLRLEQRHLVDMLSHEFRTPLAIVDAAATNLVAVPPTDAADLRRRVDQIRRAVASLAQLIANYLSNDSLERDAFEARVRETSIDPLIDDVSRLFARSPRHDLFIDLSDAPTLWPLDPFLIRIALNNLIDNALKYAPPGKVALTVRLDGESLSLMVSDSGTGIGVGEAGRIFDKFQRGRQVSGIRGTGLGLFICRGIARAHGGDIRLLMGEDSPDGGTTFELRLPRPK